MNAEYWSFALSTGRGEILFYRSNLPGNSETGFDYGESLPDGPMWNAVEDPDRLAAAWARCIATGESQKVLCRAKRNGRRFELSLWRLEQTEFAVASHGEWHYSRRELLTNAESNVCRLLSEGSTVSQIATRLEISETTVKRHRQSAMEKLEVTTHEQLGTRFA